MGAEMYGGGVGERRYVVRIETDALWKARWIADVDLERPVGRGWAEEPTIHSKRRAPDARRRETDAMRWLRERMGRDAVSAAVVLGDGAAAGFSPDQLRRAKRRLGVEVVRDGFGSNGMWKWRLPEVRPDVSDGPPSIRVQV